MLERNNESDEVKEILQEIIRKTEEMEKRLTAILQKDDDGEKDEKL